MTKIKSIVSILLVAVICMGCMALAGCGDETATTSSQGDNNTMNSKQLAMPEKGEQIAILHTNYGDIKIKFFPDAAPKAVENFIGLAKDKKYDGSIFHRVINDFMIQGGDYENANGTGGTSYFGEQFEDEFSTEVVNIRGSVAMANSGPATNGSQFFINQAGVNENGYDWNYMQEMADSYYNDILENTKNNEELQNVYFGRYYTQLIDYNKVPLETKELYAQQGGNYFLDGAYSKVGRGHTVFAQVFEGMEVVDEIAGVETDETDKPVKDVVLESVEITEY